MTIRDLLSCCMAAEIIVDTVENIKYYSMDGGNTFKKSVFLDDSKNAIEEILDHNVIKFIPTSEYRINIYCD